MYSLDYFFILKHNLKQEFIRLLYILMAKHIFILQFYSARQNFLESIFDKLFSLFRTKYLLFFTSDNFLKFKMLY